ncbi:unnamed protein product [Linum tenue]|uniref:DOG1 domain-containing protein n=1 Tax=Linum tenue TaxID=586396 RepID=A0AAV0JMM9_9ROSI|nr:unnamed protein product [Linum tenue]
MSTDSSSFQEFFDRWLVEQNLHLEDLISATTAQRPATQFLRDLAGQVMQHYEEYYQAKSAWAHQDVLDVLSPSWRTSLEEAFLWIGGWRPSTAFHLLYSKSGLQLETRLHDADDMGHRNGAVTNLPGLSTTQFHMINELHKNTIKELYVSYFIFQYQTNVI